MASTEGASCRWRSSDGTSRCGSDNPGPALGISNGYVDRRSECGVVTVIEPASSRGEATVKRTAALVVLVLTTALAGIGVAHGALSGSVLHVGNTASTSGTSATFTAVSTNDPRGAKDPGYDKNVATCTAQLIGENCWSAGNARTIKVVISNAYPSYRCDVSFTVRKGGCLPECVTGITIDAPPKLTMRDISNPPLLHRELNGRTPQATGKLRVHVEQAAKQLSTYAFHRHPADRPVGPMQVKCRGYQCGRLRRPRTRDSRA
jgi:hypothetical protein